MSEQHHESAGDSATLRPGASAPVRSRSRATWFLALASLVPGGIAVIAPEFWHGLPHTLRVTAYVLCGVMMAAVVALILTHKEAA